MIEDVINGLQIIQKYMPSSSLEVEDGILYSELTTPDIKASSQLEEFDWFWSEAKGCWVYHV